MLTVSQIDILLKACEGLPGYAHFLHVGLDLARDPFLKSESDCPEWKEANTAIERLHERYVTDERELPDKVAQIKVELRQMREEAIKYEASQIYKPE